MGVSQASAIRRFARIDLTRAIDAAYQDGRKAWAELARTWSSLVRSLLRPEWDTNYRAAERDFDMRVMEIPPFPRKIEILDLNKLFKARLSQTVVMWPGQAI